MILVDKEVALNQLEMLLQQSDTVKQKKRFSPEFKKWQRDVSAAFRHVFGEQSARVTDFNGIGYSLRMYSGSTPDYEFEEAFQRGMDTAVACVESAVDEVKVFGSSVETQLVQTNKCETDRAADPKKVFVVHGRNEVLRQNLFSFLRSIGLQPIEWSQAVGATGTGAPYVGQVLDAAMGIAQAVVVLLTPDDEAKLRAPFIKKTDPPYETELTCQARPNVLFEAGMAFGRFPEQTLLVEIGELRPFSDVAGRHAVRLTNSSQSRHDFALRLETAGCAIDLSGSDWHTIGDFDVKQCDRVQPGVIPAEAEQS